MIAPVDVLSVSPDGREGETEKARGAVPPDPVTGVNDGAAMEAVSVVLAIAWVAARGPLMASANV